MAGWRLYVAALALCCASVLGENSMPPTKIIPVPKTTPEPETTPVPHTTPSVITTAKPNTTAAPQTTTVPPKTTSEPPKTTTPPPKTTPEPPKTTTPAPKTTTEPPKTTTPAPKTTTESPKTTTVAPPPPKPTPPSAPETGVWNYTDSSTNITCIMLQMAVQFNLSYAAGKKTNHAIFNLPADSEQTGGSCSNNTQTIVLSWPKDFTIDKRNNFTLQYALNETSKQYYVSEVIIALQYDPSIFPNATSVGPMKLHNSGEEWSTGVSYSYRCKQAQSIKLAEAGTGNVAGEIIVSDLQEEAFRSVKGHQFSIAADCAPADVPDVVPIAVGCALGALVLVVLAAYLVGRRRSQARGYLSM